MIRLWIPLLTLWLFFNLTPAFGQLGPKEGAELKPTEINRVKPGDKAPDFTLEDVDGKAMTLADFRGKKAVVLVFYRGYW